MISSDQGWNSAKTTKSLEQVLEPEPMALLAESLSLPGQSVQMSPETLLLFLKQCLGLEGAWAGTQCQGRQSLSGREEREGKSMSSGPRPVVRNVSTEMPFPERVPPAGAGKLPVQAALVPGLPSADRLKAKRPSDGTLRKTRGQEMSLWSPLQEYPEVGPNDSLL